MKKISITVAVLFSLTCGSALAASTYTTDTIDLGGTDDTPELSIQLSKGVGMAYVADTDTDGLGYIVGTSHTSGTRTFASSSGDAKIFFIDAKDSDISGIDVPTGTESADFDGWSAL